MFIAGGKKTLTRILMNTKSICGLALAVAGLFASVAPASAAQFSDNDVLGTTIAGGGELSGQLFVIATSGNDGSGTFGYNPGSETLSSAIASFSFSRANSLLGQIEIWIGGSLFSSTLSVINPITGTLSGSITGGALADFAQDGVVSYKIVNNSGTAVRVSSGAVIAQSSPLPVPDSGASVYLIAFGAVALVLASRRLGVVVE